jgi:hypothetical protein
MYSIEWIGLPKHRPAIIKAADAEHASSIETAMDEADNQFVAIKRENPDIMGYRVCKKGASLFTWWSNDTESLTA